MHPYGPAIPRMECIADFTIIDSGYHALQLQSACSGPWSFDDQRSSQPDVLRRRSNEDVELTSVNAKVVNPDIVERELLD
jgi:hypothetical protein